MGQRRAGWGPTGAGPKTSKTNTERQVRSVEGKWEAGVGTAWRWGGGGGGGAGAVEMRGREQWVRLSWTRILSAFRYHRDLLFTSLIPFHFICGLASTSCQVDPVRSCFVSFFVVVSVIFRSVLIWYSSVFDEFGLVNVPWTCYCIRIV